MTLNLYGDILSDIAAQVAGSIGLAGSANVGGDVAMFEAIHGSAPDIAGKDIANPSGLLLAAVQMLVHVGQGDVAERIHNAWLATLEDGIHTGDLFNEEHSTERVGTQAFADAVIARLDMQPKKLAAVSYGTAKALAVPPVRRLAAPRKDFAGIDIFMDSRVTADELAAAIKAVDGGPFELAMITNRGVKVWPAGLPETFCTDHWRCRFLPREGAVATTAQGVGLAAALIGAGLDVVKTEHLYLFDGKPGYSLGQGQ